jgi:hypothetical protein
MGILEPTARTHVRLGIANAQRLLLDLLGTGDTEAADQEMEVFIALTERWLEISGTAPLRAQARQPGPDLAESPAVWRNGAVAGGSWVDIHLHRTSVAPDRHNVTK